MDIKNLEHNIIQYTRFILLLDEIEFDINKDDSENRIYRVYYEVSKPKPSVDKTSWPSWCRMWL